MSSNDRKGPDSTTEQRAAAVDLHGPRRFFLIVHHGCDALASEVREGEFLVVGRRWPSNVVLDDPQLSRQHARFTCVNGVVSVEDLDSRNGTFVGGSKVRTAVLGPGEQVVLGRVVASLHISSPSASLATRIVSYDDFGVRLTAALTHARRRGGDAVAVLVVRAVGDRREHVREWWPRLQAWLRPVDTIAVLDGESVLVMQPDLARDDELRTAREIVGDRFSGWSLVCGAAVFPTNGTSSEELISVAREASRRATNARPLAIGEPRSANEGASLIAESAGLRAVLEVARRVAATDVPVMILGETGSGKEVLAELMHRASRRAGQLVCLNCGAIPSGLVESELFGHVKGAFTDASGPAMGIFERANKGTVFLDEIGELPPGAQAALLRVLDTRRLTRIGASQETEVDVRVIAATNRNIERMVESGAFREDLWYRLNTVVLEVPPLRARHEDIGPLAELFIKRASKQWSVPRKSISPSALERLLDYDWPGNVRELRNIIERALVISDTDEIGVEELPERVRGARPEGGGQDEAWSSGSSSPPGAATSTSEAAWSKRVREYEVALIKDALEKTGGNVIAAAHLLEMPLRTLNRKLSKFGLRRGNDAS